MRLKGTIRAGNWLNLVDLHHNLHTMRLCAWSMAARQCNTRRRDPAS
jgi:hypothetical protein